MAVEQISYASRAGADSNVAFSADIGGLLLGLVFALGVMMLGVEERFVNPRSSANIDREDPAITSAADARVAGESCDGEGASSMVPGALIRATSTPGRRAGSRRWVRGDVEGAGEAARRLDPARRKKC